MFSFYIKTRKFFHDKCSNIFKQKNNKKKKKTDKFKKYENRKRRSRHHVGGTCGFIETAYRPTRLTTECRYTQLAPLTALRGCDTRAETRTKRREK